MAMLATGRPALEPKGAGINVLTLILFFRSRFLKISLDSLPTGHSREGGGPSPDHRAFALGASKPEKLIGYPTPARPCHNPMTALKEEREFQSHAQPQGHWRDCMGLKKSQTPCGDRAQNHTKTPNGTKPKHRTKRKN